MELFAKKAKIINLFFAVMVFAVLTLKYADVQALPDVSKPLGNTLPGVLTIKVLDVSHGDAILIRTSQQIVLIDTGHSYFSDKLMNYLADEQVSVLDKVVITHPHADHLGGLPAILEKIQVKQIYDSSLTDMTTLYKNYLELVQKHNIPFKIISEGDIIDLGGEVFLEILSPGANVKNLTRSDMNNNSIVARLFFNEFSMLFPADIKMETETRLVDKYGAKLQSTILKSPHHGKRKSSSVPFLQAVGAKAVIISEGNKKGYSPPLDQDVVKRYKDQNLEIYHTDTDGAITIISDGKMYTISKEKPLKQEAF